MAVTPVFPLLLQQMATFLTAREFETARTVGDSLTLSYVDQPDAPDAVFEEPSGEMINAPVLEQRGGYMAFLDNAREPGFYMARVDLQAPAMPIAVNVDTTESSIKSLPAEEAFRLMQGSKVKVLGSEEGMHEAIQEIRTARSFWKPLMIIGVLLLLIEGLAAGFIQNKRKS